jgi:hypothetical protein
MNAPRNNDYFSPCLSIGLSMTSKGKLDHKAGIEYLAKSNSLVIGRYMKSLPAD